MAGRGGACAREASLLRVDGRPILRIGDEERRLQARREAFLTEILASGGEDGDREFSLAGRTAPPTIKLECPSPPAFVIKMPPLEPGSQGRKRERQDDGADWVFENGLNLANGVRARMQSQESPRQGDRMAGAAASPGGMSVEERSDREGSADGSDVAPDRADGEEGAHDGYEAGGGGDTQCALCDNGGDILLCDGPCMRAFHLPLGEHDRDCNPLEVAQDLASVIFNHDEVFKCPNCLTGIHQCYACKTEGHVTGDQQELFRCCHIDCGKFYCRNCREQILNPQGGTNQIDSNGLNDGLSPIGAGAGSAVASRRAKGKAEANAGGPLFLCPLHKCRACNLGHSTRENPLVGCRRCPKAYHKHCLPDNLLDAHPQRVWFVMYNDDGSLAENTDVTRDMFYCVRHTLPEGVHEGANHSKPLFSEAVMTAWKREYAQRYSYLESCKEHLVGGVRHTKSKKVVKSRKKR